MKIGDLDIEEQVLSVTKALLVRYGVRGWNMDDLAKECSMSKRTLYKIIGNKEDLIFRCYETNFEASYIRLKSYLEQEQDYVAVLTNLASQLAQNIDEFIIAGSKSIKSEYSRIAELISIKVDKQRELLSDFLEKGQRSKVFKTNITPYSLLHIIDALMSYHIGYSKDKSEFENDIQQELNFIFNGLIA